MLKKLLMGSAFGLLLGAGAMVAEVVVRIAPPAAIVERPVPRPGPRYVWIKGYHRWENNAFVWTPGRWELPPRGRRRWIDHRWVRRGDGWVFVEGHWR